MYGLYGSSRVALLASIPLLLASCGLFQPAKPAPAQSKLGSSTFSSIAPRPTANTSTPPPTTRAAQPLPGLLLSGVISGGTLTSSGPLTLSGNAAAHANSGYVFNGAVQPGTSTITASDTATVCTDNSGSGLCVNGKPKNTTAAFVIPVPDVAALKAAHTPGAFGKIVSGSVNLNSADDLRRLLQDGNGSIRITGNLASNTALNLDGVTLVVDGTVNVNGGINAKDARLLAKTLALNGQNILQNAKFIAAQDIAINSALTSSGASTIAAGNKLTVSGNLSTGSTPTEQLALLGQQGVSINGGTASVKGVVWSGADLVNNQTLTLEGALLARGNITLNGALQVSRSAMTSNPDLGALFVPGYTLLQGRFQAATTGAYAFSATATGGFRLWVNGQPILDRWSDTTGLTTTTATVKLDAGKKYDLLLETREGVAAGLQWRRGAEEFRAVTAETLAGGSNLAEYFQLLNDRPEIVREGLQLSVGNTLGFVVADSFVLYVIDPTTRSVVNAVFNSSGVAILGQTTLRSSDNHVLYRNLLTRTSVDAGLQGEVAQRLQFNDGEGATSAVSYLYGVHLDTVRQAYAGGEPSPSTSLSGNTLRSMATTVRPLSAPAACLTTPGPSGCKEKFDVYERAVKNTSQIKADTLNALWGYFVGKVITNVGVPQQYDPRTLIIEFLGSVAASQLVNDDSYLRSILAADTALTECVVAAELCQKILVGIVVEPARVEGEGRQELSAYVFPRFNNSGNYDPDITYSAARGRVVSAGFNTYFYRCDDRAEEFADTITAVGTNRVSGARTTVSTTIQVKCKDDKSLEIASGPAALSMKVGESGSTTFTIRNKNTDAVSWTQTMYSPAYQVASAHVSPGSGATAGQGTSSFTITATCYDVGGAGFASVIRDEFGKALVLPISVSCRKPPPPPCPAPNPNCGRNWGDPHLTTLDGLDYNFQAVGEFILSRSAQSGFEVQARYKPASSTVSLTAAIAMRVGPDRVSVVSQPSGVPIIWVNGQRVTFTDNAYNEALPGGGRLVYRNSRGWVIWPDESSVRFSNVLPAGGHLDTVISVSEARHGSMSGLLGNYNGDPGDDLATRGGMVLPSQPSFEQMYQQYGESWRITQDEALFDYAFGESTSTFTDRNYPAAPTTITASQRAAAEQTCRAAGIVDAATLEGCILDVALTGDVNFANSALQNDPVARTLNLGATSITLDKGQATVLNALVGNMRATDVIDWSATGGTFTPVSSTSVQYNAPSTSGRYTVTATLRGTSTSASVTVLVVDYRLSGETRFLVTWGGSPRDLDTHLWLPASTPYHVYYGRRGDDSQCPYARLDQDVTGGFGPEIMRVKRLTGQSGSYVLAVYNFSGETTFGNAGAKVDVVGEDGRTVTSITPPADAGNGRWWNVLKFDAATGEITIVNTVGDGYEPYFDTASGCTATTMSTQRLRATSTVQNDTTESGKPLWVPNQPNIRR